MRDRHSVIGSARCRGLRESGGDRSEDATTISERTDLPGGSARATVVVVGDSALATTAVAVA